MISVSLALPFLVDGAESDGLLGALKLSHIDSIPVPFPAFPDGSWP